MQVCSRQKEEIKKKEHKKRRRRKKGRIKEKRKKEDATSVFADRIIKAFNVDQAN